MRGRTRRKRLTEGVSKEFRHEPLCSSNGDLKGLPAMSELLFVRFRTDGWPKCPNCEEDRLRSLQRFTDPVKAMRLGDFECGHCGWESRGRRHCWPDPCYEPAPTNGWVRVRV